LDFAHRPKDFLTLVTTVVMEEKEGGFALEFTVDGYAGVPVTIELAFRQDGTLEGVAPFAAGPSAGGSGAGRGNRGGSRTTDDRSDAFVLREGWGKFTAGEDRIEFGPGILARSPGRMEGEAYSWVNGSQRAEGKRVYLTGVTPFRHTLMFR
jgi:hypothetical protein